MAPVGSLGGRLCRREPTGGYRNSGRGPVPLYCSAASAQRRRNRPPRPMHGSRDAATPAGLGSPRPPIDVAPSCAAVLTPVAASTTTAGGARRGSRRRRRRWARSSRGSADALRSASRSDSRSACRSASRTRGCRRSSGASHGSGAAASVEDAAAGSGGGGGEVEEEVPP